MIYCQIQKTTKLGEKARRLSGGKKAKNATSGGNAFVTNIVLAWRSWKASYLKWQASPFPNESTLIALM